MTTVHAEFISRDLRPFALTCDLYLPVRTIRFEIFQQEVSTTDDPSGSDITLPEPPASGQDVSSRLALPCLLRRGGIRGKRGDSGYCRNRDEVAKILMFQGLLKNSDLELLSFL